MPTLWLANVPQTYNHHKQYLQIKMYAASKEFSDWADIRQWYLQEDYLTLQVIFVS